MAAKFKIGDIVTLKTKSPEMTVTTVQDRSASGDSYNYFCKWFAGSKVQSERFPEDSLDPVDDEG